MIGEVQDSLDLRRVIQLPRRVWSDLGDITERMSCAFRAPGSTASLLPLQAITLAELAQWRGVFSPIPTGNGKTLTSFLAPRMVGAVRPLLLVPSALVDKTRREEAHYRKDWVLPPFIRVEGYQTLSRVGAATLLESYSPDVVIADEAHFLKNTSAAVTKRVVRYLRENPNVPFVVLTGTPAGKSIKEFAHLLGLVLRDRAPVPLSYNALDEWSRALDCNVSDNRRLLPGALARLKGSPDEGLVAAFGRRLRETPGVVMTKAPPLDIPLQIRSVIVDTDAPQADAFRKLREDWDTPDDEPAPDGIAVWRHARELATGFYHVWVPRAPDDWKDARRAWAKVCRDTIKNNRRDIDTEEQLTQFLDSHPGSYPLAEDVLRSWREVQPTFIPNPVAHWFTNHVLQWIANWGPGLIWTDRPTIGRKLEEDFGIPYYGEGGFDARGRFVEDHDPAIHGRTICLARLPNSTGRNLQHRWHRNLVVDVPSSGLEWEQMLARTHRLGQKAPKVEVDVLVGCIEDVEAFWKAHGRGNWAGQIRADTFKIEDADLEGFVTEDDFDWTSDPRWVKSDPPEENP